MNFTEYTKFISCLNGILKNTPTQPEVFKTHHNLISLRIDNFEVFKACFKKHLMVSDWFPTHIDLFNYLDEVNKEFNLQNQAKDPLKVELNILKYQLIKVQDDFIACKEPENFDKLREEIFTTQAKIEALEEKIEINANSVK